MTIKPLLTQINTTFNVRGGGRRERDMRTSQLGPAWPAIIAPISMQYTSHQHRQVNHFPNHHLQRHMLSNNSAHNYHLEGSDSHSGPFVQHTQSISAGGLTS